MTNSCSDSSVDIGADSIPSIGYFQPSYEARAAVLLNDMTEKKQGKRGKRPVSQAATRLKRILVKNTQIILDDKFPPGNYASRSDQQKAAAREGKVSWSSIQRVLDPNKGLTLDVLADVAFGLGVWPEDILDPKYGEGLLAQRAARESSRMPAAAESSSAALQRRTS